MHTQMLQKYGDTRQMSRGLINDTLHENIWKLPQVFLDPVSAMTFQC